ncbi:ABC transporter ATP-binding protein [Sphaerisporangium siamense]|uniref:Oligopeptide/dipeptide ABC transporter ATP-binding protein n=1 Tax=Sphaerisporangium siamense TaxID=795645 RepID=A0A7W7D850_9ACTN|nr:ABC transporter ATP-binding protein [Sphaerisporangium siamense]MBB4701060.1 oligopeptide/dipeptide ABC transporter ATP-binding protein [Sphaerisporangium siamense]GII85795.1 ABC transporter ATP-binding protein [Sphaerisporangium siamense]
MSLLEIDRLSVGVLTGDDGVKLVHELSLSLEAGQTLCVVGESGSGKTVTALSIIRLLEFVAPVRTTGQVRLDDVDLVALTPEQMRSFRGRRIGMVFQEALDSLNPTRRIGAQLVEAYHPGGAGHRADLREQARARAYELLGEMGFDDPERIADLYPHQLSGGMQQRVMIAMALISGPDLLLADEPTTALDVTTQAEILRLFRSVQREHQMACVFITHDMGVAAEIADRIAVMYAGRLVEVGPAAEVLRSPRHRYTRALVECVPRIGVRRPDGLPTITGSVPGPAEELPGCRFAPRCRHSVDDCRTDEPPLAAVDGEGQVACWNPGSGPVPLPFPSAAADAPAGVATADAPAGAASPAPAREGGSEPLLVVENVRRTFTARGRRRGALLGFRRREEHAAVDGVSLSIRPGEFFGLVGESGSGKTTLGQLVAALDDPDEGVITVAGRRHTTRGLEGDVRAFRRDVQLIFQDPQSSLDPRHTVGRIIAEPLRELTDLRGPALRRRVEQLLEEVGLPASIIDRIPAQISGGQRQRVAIARAIAPEPKLIVADEPTSALDVSVQGQVMNLLLDLRRERDLAYLFITHNLSLVLSIADRVGVMKNGRLIEVAPPETITAAPGHEYTRTLLAANPGLDPDAAPASASPPGAAGPGEREPSVSRE